MNITTSSRIITDPNRRQIQYMGVGSAFGAISSRDLTPNMPLDW